MLWKNELALWLRFPYGFHLHRHRRTWEAAAWERALQDYSSRIHNILNARQIEPNITLQDVPTSTLVSEAIRVPLVRAIVELAGSRGNFQVSR